MINESHPTTVVEFRGTDVGEMGVPVELPGESGPTSQQDMNAWLSRFKLAPIAPAGTVVLSPRREQSPHEVVDLVGDGLPEPTQSVPRDHSPIRELMLSPTQEEEFTPSSPQTSHGAMEEHGIVASLRGDGDRELEQFLADMAVEARRVVASVRSQGEARADDELERLLEFMRDRCRTHLTQCFESGGWPTTETLQMLENWGLREQVGETSRQALLRRIEQSFRETYYQLQRTQYIADSTETQHREAVLVRDELATRLQQTEELHESNWLGRRPHGMKNELPWRQC